MLPQMPGWAPRLQWQGQVAAQLSGSLTPAHAHSVKDLPLIPRPEVAFKVMNRPWWLWVGRQHRAWDTLKIRGGESISGTLLPRNLWGLQKLLAWPVRWWQTGCAGSFL